MIKAVPRHADAGFEVRISQVRAFTRFYTQRIGDVLIEARRICEPAGFRLVRSARHRSFGPSPSAKPGDGSQRVTRDRAGSRRSSCG